MNWFIVISALLLIFVLIFLLRPLLRKSDQVGDGNEARAVSLSILREQQAELERELANGRIDKTAYDQAADELERRTLEDVGGSAATPSGSSRRPRTALVLGLCLPAAVAALYFTIGEPSVLEGKQASADGSHALSQEQIIGMVERLSEKLQANPNDGAGWLMLARSYSVLGRFPNLRLPTVALSD
jgi:cytochrome c-type biogenesis protein CcmH